MSAPTPSLAEFAAGGHSPGQSDRWFNDHPDVARQVDEGLRAGIPPATIFRWLRAYTDYPLKNSGALYDRRDRQKRA